MPSIRGSDFLQSIRRSDFLFPEAIGKTSSRASDLSSRASQKVNHIRQTVAASWEAFEPDVPNATWDWPRHVAYRISFHPYFNGYMGLLIIGNLIMMCFEVEDTSHARMEGREPDQLFWKLDVAFVATYVLEIGLRVYVQRCNYFRCPCQVFDFALVVLSLSDFIISRFHLELPNFPLLRIVRIARLSRAVRIMVRFPELHNIIKGFVSAMMAMIWGFAMIVLLLLIFAVVSVEMLHDKQHTIEFEDGSWCREAFVSVWKVFLMFFQNLVAGDSWGKCAIPVILAQPGMFVIFAAALVCVQLGFTNLILSSIVESAATCRQEDLQLSAARRKKEEFACVQRLSEWTRLMDTDGSGEITIEEFLEGYDSIPAVKILLQVLDIERDDLSQLFCLMDKDGSGKLSYEEFMNCIKKAEAQDLRVQMMVLKLQVSDIARMLKVDVLSRIDGNGKKAESEDNMEIFRPTACSTRQTSHQTDQCDSIEAPTEERAISSGQQDSHTAVILKDDLRSVTDGLSRKAESEDAADGIAMTAVSPCTCILPEREKSSHPTGHSSVFEAPNESHVSLGQQVHAHVKQVEFEWLSHEVYNLSCLPNMSGTVDRSGCESDGTATNGPETECLNKGPTSVVVKSEDGVNQEPPVSIPIRARPRLLPISFKWESSFPLCKTTASAQSARE
eukprot:TRINITY_DN21854_c0_g1_i1.p1 TRINITY_DN21854_c0_g1~~TRINITY_DN21854_c0_g1_i1.p1  ORF type:complete len:685 (-),score=104.97 TRINITY_DN21854_c0_g1_i1:26-2044(-)